MTARAFHVLAAAAWWSALAILVVWWLPSIALVLARLWDGRVRARLRRDTF